MASVTPAASSLGNFLEEIAKDENIHKFGYEILPGAKDADHFLGEIYRAKIRGQKFDGEDVCLNLVIKKIPRSREMRENIPLEIMYKREVWAYTDVLPSLYKVQVDHGVPYEDRFHCTKLYKGKDEMIALEDLCCNGFKLSDKLESIDREHLIFSIKNLARYHATSFVVQNQNPELYKRLVEGICKKHEYWYNLDVYFDKLKPVVLGLFEDLEKRSKVEDIFKDALKNFEFVLDSEGSSPYNVICHGDPWTNNFLFSYKNGKISEMRMVDWQAIRYGSPVIDLAYFIFSSTDQKIRKEFYEEVLEIYYETLKYNTSLMGVDLSTCYPRNAFDYQIRKYMVYGLLIAIMVLPITMTTEQEVPGKISGHVVKPEDGGHPVVFTKRCRIRMIEVIEDFFKYDY